MKTFLIATTALVVSTTAALAGGMQPGVWSGEAFAEYGVNAQDVTLGGGVAYDINSVSLWTETELQVAQEVDLSLSDVTFGADYAILPQVDAYMAFEFAGNPDAANGLGVEYNETSIGLRYEW